MALILDIAQNAGTIVLHNVPTGAKTALGIEDVRLIKVGTDRIEVQTEAPTSLLKSVLDISAGELSIDGVVSATSDIAISDFGTVIEAARGSGGGGGGDATAANQTTQIGLETSIKTNTDNLDVALSTRASEATLGDIKTNTSSTVTELTDLNGQFSAQSATFDVNLSTLASETTLGEIKTPIVDNIDAKLSTLETTLNSIESNTATAGLSTPVDAAGSVPVNNSTTWLNALQTNDDLPLIYDRVNIGGATQLHNGTFARTEMRVFTAGDAAIAQTRQRFPYFAGSPQQIKLTFSRADIQTDVQKEFGYYSFSSVSPHTADKDGISIYNDGSTLRLRVYRLGAIIHDVPRSSWDDPLDGTGASGMNLLANNFNAIGFDFLWLGGTGINFYIFNGYEKIRFHTINHANGFNGVMMSSPIQPITYEIRTTNGAGNLDQICASVSSGGNLSDTGNLFSTNTGSTFINANTIGTKYLLNALRINTNNRDTFVQLKSFSCLPATGDDLLIEVIYNPTIASSGSLIWGNVSGSKLQAAIGASGNPSPTTVTGGTVLFSQYGQSFDSPSAILDGNIRLGTAIDGVQDVLAIVVTPLGSNLDIRGGVSWLEI